jgi:hypothetical protein
VVAYHFCQADNAPTCLVPELVHSLAAQLAQAPQLAAYYQHLKASPAARALVSLPSCRADPSAALLQGVLRPLARLASPAPGAAPLLLLVDGLCEAEQHRPDTGPGLTAFLAAHLALLPAWLRLVATGRPALPAPPPGLERLELAGPEAEGDLREYVLARCAAGPAVLASVRGAGEEPQARLAHYLATRARGCFLYVKLIIDFIERGQLVIKSGSFKVLPQTLSEVFHLAFNLKFSSSQSYGPAGELLAAVLACLTPPSQQELHAACSAPATVPLTRDQFLATYRTVAEWLVPRSDGSLMLFHPTLRDWLLGRRDGDSGKFLPDLRAGHTALALALARRPAPLRPDRVLQLGHHVLKAGMFRGLGAGELGSRDLQAAFLALAAGDPSPGLAAPRNLHSPLTKVSRLLLLAGADPDLAVEEGGEAVPLLVLHAGRGHLQMVSLLLEFCARVEPSALGRACGADHTEVARLLLACGAAPGPGAVEVAAAAGHLGPVQLLAGEGAGGLQEALTAALASDRPEVAAWLLTQPGVSPDSPDGEGRLPLEVEGSWWIAGAMQPPPLDFPHIPFIQLSDNYLAISHGQ